MPTPLRLGADILTASQMRAAEQALFDAGVSVATLMERAGRGAADYVWRMAGPGRLVTVLTGPGNNGGDGWVIARALQERGGRVQVAMAAAPTGEVARAMRRVYEGPVVSGEARGDVLVDCLYGTGLSRALSGADLALLNGLAGRHRHRIAIDLPSGVEADRGDDFAQDLPRYDLTIALGAWKRAHGLMPAVARMGALRLVDIGCAPVPGAGRRIEGVSIAAPAMNAHKYTRGLLGVVVGAMHGAALMAARAAGGAGAGYVRLLCDAPLAAPDDLVVQGLDGLSDKRLSAVLVGPGLGRGGAARAILERALANPAPMVLDGDGLHLVTPAMVRDRESLIVTPHEGELAALEKAFGLDGAGGKAERALVLAKAGGMVVVAKGPDTVIAAPDGRWMMAPPASSWLSVAGSGDVLAGCIASRLAAGDSGGAGRLAAGHDDFVAAGQGVWLHGRAAVVAGKPFTAMALAQAVSAAVEQCL